MYNVILLNKCNLRCSYCFAEDYMHGEEKQQAKAEDEAMSEAMFDQVVKFLVDSNVYHVSLLGGEPTLHPQFRKFWLKASSHKTEFSLKSNALWDADMLAFFNTHHDDDRYSFLLNVNGPERLTTQQWETVQRNTIGLKSAKKSLQLNIERPDFEYQWIIDLALRAGANHIQWSLAAPQAIEEKRQHSAADYYSFKGDMRGRLYRFLRDAGHAGLTTMGTHGPTPCLLLPEQYQEIKQLGGDIDGRCIPVFDIFPNGGIHYCFPLKDFVHPPIVADMADLQQVRSLFMRDLFTLRTINFPWEECATCPEALATRCHGGCLAQKKMTATKKTQSNEYFYQVVPILNPDILMSIDRHTLVLGRFSYVTSGVKEKFLAKVDGTLSLAEIFSELEAHFEEVSEVAKREAFFHLVSDLAGAGIVHSLPLKPFEEN